METMTRVKCGNCHGFHPSAAAVRLCYFPPPRPVAPAAVEHSRLPGVDPATQAQLNYLRDLGADMQRAVHYTKTWASREIKRLKEAKAMDPKTTAPNRSITKVPLDFLNMVPDGYYAVRPDEFTAHTFFRISRPKPTAKSQFAGCLKVQTQHGPDYDLAFVVWRDGKITVYNKAIEDALLLVCVDANGAAIEYANVIGRCMRCNTELTDERSRWFGIGPECERKWPHIIDIQTDKKGPFVYGWEARRNA